MVREASLKVWRSKFQNIYIPPGYSDEIDKGVFDFDKYRKKVYGPQQTWKEGICTNLITFNDEKYI